MSKTDRAVQKVLADRKSQRRDVSGKVLKAAAVGVAGFLGVGFLFGVADDRGW